jgi:hypothetical protein
MAIALLAGQHEEQHYMCRTASQQSSHRSPQVTVVRTLEVSARGPDFCHSRRAAISGVTPLVCEVRNAGAAARYIRRLLGAVVPPRVVGCSLCDPAPRDHVRASARSIGTRTDFRGDKHVPGFRSGFGEFQFTIRDKPTARMDFDILQSSGPKTCSGVLEVLGDRRVTGRSADKDVARPTDRRAASERERWNWPVNLLGLEPSAGPQRRWGRS